MNHPLPHLLPHSREISTSKPPGSSRRIISLLVGLTFIFLFSCVAEARTVKWEYTVIPAGYAPRQLQNLLNSYGLEGWELVQINVHGVAVLKREKR
jgi:hypothetical protein